MGDGRGKIHPLTLSPRHRVLLIPIVFLFLEFLDLTITRLPLNLLSPTLAVFTTLISESLQAIFSQGITLAD